MSIAVEKELSGNDTGETGGHQAGMLIPKTGDILGFFPALTRETKNPRTVIDVVDETGKEWSFNFIYYNSKFYGGTRNEYRLTGMTAFIRAFNLKTGDTIRLEKVTERQSRIRYRRKNQPAEGGVLKLGQGAWRVVDFADDD
jgi:Restriction endonuclease EcoRII, N-terminal